MSTLRQLDPAGFKAWLAKQGLTKYQLEHKSSTSIPEVYWRRWARGLGITRKLQQRLLSLGAPETIFLPMGARDARH